LQIFYKHFLTKIKKIAVDDKKKYFQLDMNLFEDTWLMVLYYSQFLLNVSGKYKNLMIFTINIAENISNKTVPRVFHFVCFASKNCS